MLYRLAANVAVGCCRLLQQQAQHTAGYLYFPQWSSHAVSIVCRNVCVREAVTCSSSLRALCSPVSLHGGMQTAAVWISFFAQLLLPSSHSICHALPAHGVVPDVFIKCTMLCLQVRVYLRNVVQGMDQYKSVWNEWVDKHSPVHEHWLVGMYCQATACCLKM